MKYQTAIAVLALLFAQSSAIKLRGVFTEAYDDLLDGDSPTALSQKEEKH